MTAYRDRLEMLPVTIEQAGRMDVEPIVAALQASLGQPMLTVGSGGSLITAGLLARLVERLGDTVARSVTPLDLVSRPQLVARQQLWLMSAEGTNPDILAAFDAARAAEPARMTIFCNRADSPLVRLAEEARSPSLVYPTDGQKDGFLATHTLILSSLLLLRAGAHIAAEANPIPSPDALDRIESEVIAPSLLDLDKVLAARTLLVVYDPLLRDGADLIETNLWEAALANVQAVDFRRYPATPSPQPVRSATWRRTFAAR